MVTTCPNIILARFPVSGLSAVLNQQLRSNISLVLLSPPSQCLYCIRSTSPSIKTPAAARSSATEIFRTWVFRSETHTQRDTPLLRLGYQDFLSYQVVTCPIVYIVWKIALKSSGGFGPSMNFIGCSAALPCSWAHKPGRVFLPPGVLDATLDLKLEV